MIVELERFIVSINSKPHIQRLFRDEETIFLEIAGYTLKLTASNASVVPACRETQGRILRIRGEDSSVKAMLEGERKLRELSAKGLVEVDVSFRTALLLESVFRLAK